MEGFAPATGISFQRAGRRRQVLVGSTECAISGLPELADNNPMVCADVFSVPSAGVTLALVALGPLARAGVLAAPPALMANVPIDDEELDRMLADLGWVEGAVVDEARLPMQEAYALTAIAEVAEASESDLDDLFEEAYGRSVYVRRNQSSHWDGGLVASRPFAVYRMGQDTDGGLLTVHVLADPDGKCGAAQIVHAMNIMTGLEESLGIA